ncbi:ABC transporter permease [Sphingomonas jatrophae]|uniref:Sulfonate transport system permease protein n=1 Tax=Sphingomonas jatrophae TaxID=1166337 RepID=A0A1I6KA35_9SPHN|nr:ABC transporter permease [Sphingomonas jatrophae]SFR88066.1 sulfonate transport system permease protein [Sphingomonas jatrophae]
MTRARFDPLLSLVGLLALLLAWWTATRLGVFPRQVLAPPESVWRAFVQGAGSGELGAHILASLGRLGTGYAAGALVGAAFGLAMALSREFEAYTSGLFHAVRQVPTIAFIPMLVLVFGVEETFKIVVVAKASFYPVALAVFTGIRGISAKYLDVAAVYTLSLAQRLRLLMLPAALPPVLTGLRLGLSRAWVALVAAELLVADEGIGQMMEMGRQMFRLDIVLMGVVVIGTIGFLLDHGFKLLERRLTKGMSA